ncbi:hypothetical protein EV131_103251 [Rhizobium laguerreae]|uniref:Uncharacterized protein n=1 Tax=Rhizobium laguerreae TaxID=1076926 RepID=A0AAX2QPB9_9HYPH|nr:hypothetical protein EV131_103251 [Rhizobium laguerreae]
MRVCSLMSITRFRLPIDRDFHVLAGMRRASGVFAGEFIFLA